MTGFGWVYVMQRADGVRKVGCSADVADRRIKLHAVTGIKHKFERAWKMPLAEARLAERLIHLKLKPQLCPGLRSREVYRLPLKRIREVVEWASKLAADAYARGVPKDLSDEEVIQIAARDDDALVQMATRGAVAWRSLLHGVRVRADEDISEDVAEQMIADFHAFCEPAPGRMIRRDGKFVFLCPGWVDLHEKVISRSHLAKIIDGAKRRLPV